MRRRRRECPEQVFIRIFFYCEGRPRPYQCDCLARKFRIDPNDASLLTCTHGRKHHVPPAYFTEDRIELDPDRFEWIPAGVAIRGVQLPLPFPRRAIKIGR